MDTEDVAADIKAALDLDIKYQPTHIWTEDGGMRKIRKKRKFPDPVQVSLLEQPLYLATNVVWSDLAFAARIEIAIGCGLPSNFGLMETVFDALPEQTRTWLTGWQMQINSGSCWHTAGEIGRAARGLIEDGFLLASKESRKNYYGGTVATREQIPPGRPGSALFVRTIMGQPYLDWISTIE